MTSDGADAEWPPGRTSAPGGDGEKESEDAEDKKEADTNYSLICWWVLLLMPVNST